MTDLKRSAQDAIKNSGGANEAARAQTLLSAINALLALESSNAFAGHCYAPGRYVPSQEAQRFLLEEELEANVAPLKLVSKPPALPAPPAAEPEMRMEDLLAFLRSLGEQTLDDGIADLALRRAARALPSPLPIVEALTRGDMREAQTLLLADREARRALIEAAQARIQELADVPQISSQAQAVETLVLSRLDQVLTASTLRLQGDLFALGVEAQSKHALISTHHAAFDAARDGLIVLSHSFTTAVARLALLWERRDDVKSVLDQFKTIEERSQSLEAQLLAIENAAQTIARDFEALEGRYLPLRERGTTLLRSLRELASAARILGVSLPTGVTNQIEKVTEPLESTLTLCAEQFQPLSLPEVDQKLQDALAEINSSRTRKNHLVNPIRPSVFKHRLDRDEEVQRLVLIGFHLLTNSELKGKPHEGRGKKSGVIALVAANLLDTSETDRAVALVTAHKDADPKLLEAIRVGRFWRYRPTQEGRAQALVWLAQCVDHNALVRQIDEGRKAANKAFHLQRSNKAMEED